MGTCPMIVGGSRHLVIDRFPRWLVMAILATVLGACGTNRQVVIAYSHPSPLSRYGRHIGVVPFDNEGDTRISQRIREGFQASPAFDLPPLEQQQMRVTGQVLESSIGPEQGSGRPHTCSRQVPEVRTIQVPIVIPQTSPTGQMLAPRIEMHTEQFTEMVARPYACTELVRSISATFHARVMVNAMTHPIRTVYDQDIDLTDTQTELGLSGSDSQDHPPPPVDGPALLESLQGRAANGFVRLVLPRSDRTVVEFADCRDPRCDNAMVSARNGSYDAALIVLTQVVNDTASPTDDRGRNRLASALFNRGVIRGYTGSFADGILDLSRAIALCSTEPFWGTHLVRLQGLQHEREASAFHGETTTPGQEQSAPRHARPAPHTTARPHPASR